ASRAPTICEPAARVRLARGWTISSPPVSCTASSRRSVKKASLRADPELDSVVSNNDLMRSCWSVSNSTTPVGDVTSLVMSLSPGLIGAGLTCSCACRGATQGQPAANAPSLDPCGTRLARCSPGYPAKHDARRAADTADQSG